MAYESRRKNRSLERTIEYLAPYDVILIVCEGTHTEPCYFNKLIVKENLSSANIDVTGQCGSDPVSVVTYAIDLYKKREGDTNIERKFDRVYCVIDEDNHSKFDAAMNKLNQFNKDQAKNILIPIRSYPCFEYWFICHFEFSRAEIKAIGKKSSGTICESYLNKIWKAQFKQEYRKSNPENYSLLEGKQKDGIKHSKMGLKDAEAISTLNPSTEVHLLVEYLLSLKRPKNKR